MYVLQVYYAKADINTEHRRRPTDCGLLPAFVWGNVKFSILKAAKIGLAVHAWAMSSEVSQAEKVSDVLSTWVWKARLR